MIALLGNLSLVRLGFSIISELLLLVEAGDFFYLLLNWKSKKIKFKFIIKSKKYILRIKKINLTKYIKICYYN